MAWSFRKSIKIAPGIRLNFSKSGISTSFGPRGAKVTVGPKGTYLHTGIPGTGIYNRQKVSSSIKPVKYPSSSSSLFDSSSSVSKSRSSSFEGYGVNMNMDRSGIVTYSFTDNFGHAVTDEATIQKLIRKTKSLPIYKEKLALITKMTYDEVNADTEAFTDLFKKTPRLRTEPEVIDALATIKQKQYTPLAFEEAVPDKEDIRRRLALEAEEKINHLLWWKNKPARKEYVEENLSIVFDKEMRDWERRRDEFAFQQSEIRWQKELEYYNEYLKEKKPLEAFVSRNEEVVLDALRAESTIIGQDVPGDIVLTSTLDYEYGVLYVSLDLPEIEEIPKDKAVYLPSGNISFKLKTKKEIQMDYIKCVCGLAFFVTGRLFNVNSAIQYIQVSGYTQRINKGTGQTNEDYVYSVFFDRNAFSNLIVESIDPLEAMYGFPNRVKASVTGVLSTINPFSMPGETAYERGKFPQREL